jgi:phage terminase large subunit-like protein
VNTHVATILERAHPEFKPEYFASKDILVWPNGATTYLFSAEKPENIRSVNLSYAWVDEAAFMDEIETAWMNLKLATRIEKPGNPIHILITSTPTSTPWVMEMEDDPDVEVRRVSTYANLANLSPDFIKMLKKEYEGTRMGRQELYGEVLRDVEGALWNDEMFRHLRIEDPVEFIEFLETLDDRVLAVDPAGSKGPKSDKHGIIAAGAHHFDDDGSPLPASNFFVMGRATLKGSPGEMAERTFSAARVFRVNRIIVEKNFGGEHVKSTLEDWAKLNPIKACDENGEAYKIELVHASQSKETRAEPTVGKYEQGRVTHVTNTTAYGDLSELEKQQVGWVPKSRGGRQPSPNDIDALVWAIRALETKVRFAAQTASSREVMKHVKNLRSRWAS